MIHFNLPIWFDPISLWCIILIFCNTRHCFRNCCFWTIELPLISTLTAVYKVTSIIWVNFIRNSNCTAVYTYPQPLYRAATLNPKQYFTRHLWYLEFFQNWLFKHNARSCMQANLQKVIFLNIFCSLRFWLFCLVKYWHSKRTTFEDKYLIICLKIAFIIIGELVALKPYNLFLWNWSIYNFLFFLCLNSS